MIARNNESSPPKRYVPQTSKDEAEAEVEKVKPRPSAYGIGFLPCCGDRGCVVCLGEVCP